MRERDRERQREREREREKERKTEREVLYLYKILGSESLRKSSKYGEGVRLIRLSTSSPNSHL